MKEEEIRNNESTSKKNDFKDNKLRWDLLPLETIENLVKVYSFGSKNIQIIVGRTLTISGKDTKQHYLDI